MNSPLMRRMYTEQEIASLPFKSFSHVLTEEDIAAGKYKFDRRDFDGKNYISSVYICIFSQKPDQFKTYRIIAAVACGTFLPSSTPVTTYLDGCSFGGKGIDDYHMNLGENRCTFTLLCPPDGKIFKAGETITICFYETDAICPPIEI